MSELLLKKIEAEFPDLPKCRTLLAVSGGQDSMGMVHLFAAAGWSFGIAHCNFQLRGTASDQDHDLVKMSALQLGVTFHSIHFDTAAEAAEKGISIQMAARELRYPWLEAIRGEHRYDYIATAHHLNDSIETSLLNQTRGTGLRGLTGIPARRGQLIRPLLSLSREEIENYVAGHQVTYREDSSNAKDDYHRNRIRHHVIPVLRSINPAFEQTFQKNLKIWKESTYLLEWACETLGRQYLLQEGEVWSINYQFLQEHPAAASSLLFAWLKAWGFHLEQVQQAIQAAGQSVGAVWYSASHRLLADREAFLVAPIGEETKRELIYQLPNAEANCSLSDGHLQSTLIIKKEWEGIHSSEWVADLDAATIAFPLTIRHWREGDVFCPLGMNGQRKKVQDFFTDQKLSRFDKEKVWLVVTAREELVWIIGYRIDERFKVTDGTEKILKLKFLPAPA